MKEPSAKWQRTRRAVLDSVSARSLGANKKLLSIYTLVGVLFAAGWVKFNLSHKPSVDFSIVDNAHLLATGASGLFIVWFAPAAFLALFNLRKFQKISDE